MDLPHQAVSLLTEPISHWGATRPDHPAVSMVGTELSYGELDRRSNQVANLLMKHGVRRGDRVGLFGHKSIDLVSALFGIMKAGAAYVPLNPDAPAAYVRHIVEECDIRHLVTGSTRRQPALDVAAETSVSLVMGITGDGETSARLVDWPEVWAYDEEPPDRTVGSDDLAYVIFTSGSTGKPKGIMHSHRSGLAYAKAAAAVYGFRPSDRITNHAPLNFDLSTLELFAGSLAGATQVIVPEGHARLPASFSQLLESERVTVINAVPFALVQLLHRGALNERDLSKVRWVLFGGEVFPTRDLRALMHRLPDAAFANVYGPAEVNGVTYHIVPDLPEDMDAPISIGCLYPGMEAMVVDDADREVPDGMAGELLINSETHMIGYWGQEEMTERGRLRIPDGDGGESVYYRTGDVVERNPDGTFHLHGRKDRQIKVRGHRIELDEIETAAMSHPSVEQAIVYAVPDGHGSNEVRAMVTLLDDRPPATADELMAHLTRVLPRYATPAELEIAAAVPRTLSGKADRVALVARATGRGEGSASSESER